MAAEIALAIQEQTDRKLYVICLKENEETIAAYKDKVVMLEMKKAKYYAKIRRSRSNY